jgi:hypothetical protein
VIVKLAMRSLFAHPVRSAVLAAGFGTGVAVMAILLGVAQVVLEQARSPVLIGGGDVVITGAATGITAAGVLLSSTLRTPPLAGRARAASPSSRTTLYLVRDAGATSVRARGGIPSLERALGDPEVSGVTAWVDAPADAAWTAPDPADVLRTIDRFRPVPDVPARAASWAEWLYFNGRSPAARFYLTFLVGPARPDGTRGAGVRLQLERGGRVESFDAAAALDEAAVAAAPELTIGANRVRLQGRGRTPGGRRSLHRERSGRDDASDRDPWRWRVALGLRRARDVRQAGGDDSGGWRTCQPGRRRRLPRSQLGVLAGSVMAVGRGSGW